MAGRPPAGGTTGLLAGMCVSIGVALIALVLLVVLWTNQEELQASADKANSEAQRLMKSGERQGALKAWYNKASGGKSLAKLMHDEMAELGEIISAESPSPSPDLVKQLRNNQLDLFWDSVKKDSVENDEIRDDLTKVVQRPLLDALESLYDLYKAEKEAKRQNRATIEELNSRIEGLIETSEKLREDFDQIAGELRARLAAIEDEWAGFRKQKEDEFSAIEKAGQQRADQRLKAEQKLRGQIRALGDELAKREARAKELQGKLREFQILPQARMAARQADGKILMAKPGEESVFIDLGADDHLVLGMRFAVYPPDTGIPSSGVSKAAIEVVSIGEEVSQCRIKEMNPLFPILEGDLIANPIYDRNRSLTFYVVGEFDLNYDGRDDPNGKGTIKAVIKENGGIIADQLSARVDFVVAGARPPLGRISADPSPEVRAIHEDQVRKVDAYSADINEAQSLSIPIFTQETFLNFLGRAR